MQLNKHFAHLRLLRPDEHITNAVFVQHLALTIYTHTQKSCSTTNCLCSNRLNANSVSSLGPLFSESNLFMNIMKQDIVLAIVQNACFCFGKSKILLLFINDHLVEVSFY